MHCYEAVMKKLTKSNLIFLVFLVAYAIYKHLLPINNMSMIKYCWTESILALSDSELT